MKSKRLVPGHLLSMPHSKIEFPPLMFGSVSTLSLKISRVFVLFYLLSAHFIIFKMIDIISFIGRRGEGYFIIRVFYRMRSFGEKWSFVGN